MSLLDVKVELGLNAFGWTGGNFVLDSDTLGLLGTSTISGFAFYDVTDRVQSVSTKRGKSRQLDNFNAGSATIVFRNDDRLLDPLNEDSPIYLTVNPRVVVKVTANDLPLFYGLVNDWDFEFDISNQDTAVASCSDAFSILSNQLLSAFTPSAQLTGARVNAVLNRSEINYRGGRQIAVGASTLGAYAVDENTNPLNYLRQVERSELGQLFVAADGRIIFRERAEVPSTPILHFSDDGSALPYQSLTNQYGDELLYNYIRAQSPAGAEQVRSDATSIATYQISQLAYTDLLNSSTTEVANLAQTILTTYKEPKIRFTDFSVQILGLDETDRNSLYAAELSDYIEIEKTFAVGAPSSIVQDCLITSIAHNISPGSHTVTFGVDSADFSLRLVLGDSFAGRLDVSILDF
jgi:hypothetical protein